MLFSTGLWMIGWVCTLHDTLTDLIDRHCPVSSVRKRIVKLSLWFDSECRQQRKETRKLEKAYRKSHLPSDHLAWTVSLKYLHRLYETKSKEFWCTKTAESRGDSRKLWWVIPVTICRLMPLTVLKTLRSTFCRRYRLHSEWNCIGYSAGDTFMDVEHLSSFATVTVEEVEKLISKAANKTCKLDPMLTWLIKKYRSLLAPFVATLFNAS